MIKMFDISISTAKYHDTIFHFLKHHNNFIYFIIVEVLFK